MTDKMTAEQALNAANELMARLPILTDDEARDYLVKIRMALKALSEPRVPEEIANVIERWRSSKVASSDAMMELYMLTAAPAPANDTSDEYADFIATEGHQLCGDLLDAMVDSVTTAPANITLETDLSKMVGDYPGAVDWTGSTADEIAALPADWSQDSSLETWFPYTAQELAKLRERVKVLEEQWAVVFDGHAVMQHMEAANQYAYPPLICATLDAVAAIGKERAARLCGGSDE